MEQIVYQNLLNKKKLLGPYKEKLSEPYKEKLSGPYKEKLSGLCKKNLPGPYKEKLLGIWENIMGINFMIFWRLFIQMRTIRVARPP